MMMRDTASQSVTFCVALPDETFPVVDQVVALERRGAPVPTADPLSRRYHQQDHCCCEDAGHTECPAVRSLHAYRLPTNVDCDEAAVASVVVPSMSST
jgi:hypothetical protein